MKKYDTYKTSGVEWIGQIPSHWEAKKLKRIANIVLGKMLTTQDSGELILRPYLRAANLNWLTVDVSDVKEMWFSKEELQKLRIKEGDLLVSEGGEVGRACIWRNELSECYIQNSVHKITVDEFEQYSKFHLYQFFSFGMRGLFDMIVNRISIAHLTVEKIREVTFLCPPVSEQIEIATYLDRKTAEIDSLIADKKRLLELFEEEKTAIINQAVTKGLDSKVEMKDSGIEWVGEMPSHWQAKRIKYVIKGFESGVSVNSLDNPVMEGEYGILKTSCVYGYTFRPEENKVILNDLELMRAKINPKKGMIIISRMNTPDLVGASGYVDKDYPNLFLPDRLWQTIFHDNVEINTMWLSFVLKSMNFRKLLSALATGTSPSMKNIGQGDFLNIIIPIPDKKEQQLIVHHIETECSLIDAQIAKTKRLIELLSECRTALISEVVTGKIKVTD